MSCLEGVSSNLALSVTKAGSREHRHHVFLSLPKHASIDELVNSRGVLQKNADEWTLRGKLLLLTGRMKPIILKYKLSPWIWPIPFAEVFEGCFVFCTLSLNYSPFAFLVCKWNLFHCFCWLDNKTDCNENYKAKKAICKSYLKSFQLIFQQDFI